MRGLNHLGTSRSTTGGRTLVTDATAAYGVMNQRQYVQGICNPSQPDPNAPSDYLAEQYLRN